MSEHGDHGGRDEGTAPGKALAGARVMDESGVLIGRALGFWQDEDTGVLTFVGVRDGVLGSRRHLIPLAAAEIGYERIDVPYSRSQVMASPAFEAGRAVLDEDEAAVCVHYGLTSPTPWLE
ncbi:PRC-barrel-like [Propionibacterium ruminifibrarum]|jgi:hypothetical protein|uniref:PRC-barrel-like n=1 Tax=Propionibacterium ruminifibrarum TaxID=1962131 RepID=A0A375I4Z5_9ACTN|nr:PRC-barrel domain-containing protein [Propionibacterium ruminifibrarum]SPF68839.1 PRC-barrel-like [Propionibacterium ruminifibrarum]